MLKEHLRDPFPFYHGNLTSMDCFTIIGREAHGIMRKIKEAIQI